MRLKSVGVSLVERRSPSPHPSPGVIIFSLPFADRDFARFAYAFSHNKDGSHKKALNEKKSDTLKS